MLLRHYTQNIDTLERVAGIPSEKLVEAHGSFGTARCLACSHPHSAAAIKDTIMSSKIPYCEKCSVGVVKPDIVFYGENLPGRFFEMRKQDFPNCDLLFVLGTSLTVQPFCELVERVGDLVPRVLVNREKVGNFEFDVEKGNYRDVAALGLCDEMVYSICEKLGWEKDLLDLIVSAS